MAKREIYCVVVEALVCRLFGLRSSTPSRAHRSLLEAENAVVSQSERNPDGWGIGWFDDDDAYVVKSPIPAHQCDRFRQVSSRLRSQTFVVHVRKATVGAVDPVNSHPFRHGRWLFAHNGTVHGMDVLRPWLEDRTDPLLRAQILGDTDSELLFYFILTTLAAAGIDRSGRAESDPRGVAGGLRLALGGLDAEARTRGLPRPRTNLILTDGRLFIAHRAGLPLHMTTQKRYCNDRWTCGVASKACLEMIRRAPGSTISSSPASRSATTTTGKTSPTARPWSSIARSTCRSSVLRSGGRRPRRPSTCTIQARPVAEVGGRPARCARRPRRPRRPAEDRPTRRRCG